MVIPSENGIQPLIFIEVRIKDLIHTPFTDDLLDIKDLETYPHQETGLETLPKLRPLAMILGHLYNYRKAHLIIHVLDSWA
jgi:hypothetical protein